MHALVFTLWTCLIVVQPLLIAKGAIGIHRRLGIAGAGLAVLVWIFGNLAAAEAIEAGYKGLGDPYAFYAITFFSIKAYGIIGAMGIAWRRRAEPHMRLMRPSWPAEVEAEGGG